MKQKTLKFMAIFLALVLLGVLLSGAFLFRFGNTSLPVPESGVVFVVPKAASTTKIAHLLYEKGIVSHPLWLLFWIKYEKAWSQLKAGEYLIKKETTPRQLITQFVEGKVIQYALTIVEGATFQDILAKIAAEPKLKQSLAGLSYEEIMARLGHPGEHPEGRFYPDTYYFPAGTTDVAFLQRAYHLLEKKLNASWATRAPDLPLNSSYEALILASIIEKESNLKEEYGEIAGVYTRRLLKNMPLQADPTVIYGLGKNTALQLTKETLKIPTPYNTYAKLGLPPTPIAMPSLWAIAAATHPTPGESLYFVAKANKKGHVFSKTLQEHIKAVAEYRKAIAIPTPTLTLPQQGE
jgi:UPF0755 protein